MKLAKKIKDFLNRLVRDHKSIDVEWIKKCSTRRGEEIPIEHKWPGLEEHAVRAAFDTTATCLVDANVSRIAVRLGWVPIQSFDETFLLHMLYEYPKEDTIQEYLWPRLCTLDLETLYELHYHQITFGKDICTKRKPNCNACPLKGECRYFSSACASARLRLPGLGEQCKASWDIEDSAKLSAKESNALTPEVLIQRMPKLTYESRLRTKHKVYVLSDSHHLLEGQYPREPDDSYPYLLSIWISEETSNFVQQPNFQTNGTGGQNPPTVLGTILIPCRTAMRGRFPLNGTYFQVFADDESSDHPIDVSVQSIRDLDMKTLY